MTMCVQQKGRLLMEVGEDTQTVTQRKNKLPAKKKEKGKIPPEEEIKKERPNDISLETETMEYKTSFLKLKQNHCSK